MGLGITGTEFAMTLSTIPMYQNPVRRRTDTRLYTPILLERPPVGFGVGWNPTQGIPNTWRRRDEHHRRPRGHGLRNPYRRLRDRRAHARRRARRHRGLRQPGPERRGS